MVLLSLGLYTVTLNIVPLLMEEGAGYATAALGWGWWGRAGRRPPPLRRHSGACPLGASRGAGAVAVLSLAVLPGPPGC